MEAASCAARVQSENLSASGAQGLWAWVMLMVLQTEVVVVFLQSSQKNTTEQVVHHTWSPSMHMISSSALPAPCRPPSSHSDSRRPIRTIQVAPPHQAAAAILAAAMLHFATPSWAADTPQASTPPSRPGGVDPDTSPLVQELLARSKANKEANDKARLVRLLMLP